jgi:hypothetical protein
MHKCIHVNISVHLPSNKPHMFDLTRSCDLHLSIFALQSVRIWIMLETWGKAINAIRKAHPEYVGVTMF